MIVRGLRPAVCVALLLWAAPAWADPVSLISYAIYYFGGQTLTAAVGAFLFAVAAGSVVASRARKKGRAAFNASLTDRTITVRGATEPRRMVLGRQRVGGVVAFVASTGANKEKFVMVVTLAGHEIDGIEQIYFNAEPVTLSGEYVQTAPYASTAPLSVSEQFTGDGSTVTFNVANIPISGTVYAVQETVPGESVSFTIVSVSGTAVTLDVPPLPTAIFSIGYQRSVTTSFARVRTFLGAAGQTVDPVVNSLFPTEWDSSHPMTGCAGLAIFFDFNEDAFQTEVEVSALVRGAKLYDPRLDSTAGGSGPHRLNDASTWTWSENPALEIGYAAMSPLCGRQPSTAINWPRLAVAANKCDEQVDYSTWSSMTDESGNLLTDENGNQLQL